MRARPAPDDMQNIMLTSATEMDGHTNLVFYRKRKTGDTEKDVEIKVLNDIIQFTLKRSLFYLSIDTEITLNCCGRCPTQGRPCRQEEWATGCCYHKSLNIYVVTHSHPR